ncbi:MAG: acyltransferase [Candidatus Krumholzibacteriota bacterium]|nr:acyltransferase [Candidatus Krumholzibacteriota bacterium]
MPNTILNPQTGKITIGKNCSINPFCELRGRGDLTIGDDTRIGTGSAFYPNKHIYKDPDILIRLQGETHEGITIENDVFIGSNVKVLDGVSIGTGCVVGAGSVVTKTIPPYSVAVGVPAKVIKQRK